MLLQQPQQEADAQDDYETAPPAPSTASGEQQQQDGGVEEESDSCHTDGGSFVYLDVYYTEEVVGLTRSDIEVQVEVTNTALRRAGAAFELVLLLFEQVGVTARQYGAALQYLTSMVTGFTATVR